jgi:hypothetical protein
MVKFRIAAVLLPLLVTEALVPGRPVVTGPKLIVAAAPCAPVGPAPPAGASNDQLPELISGVTDVLLGPVAI